MASFFTENVELGILSFQSGFRFLILSKKNNLIPVFSGNSKIGAVIGRLKFKIEMT